MDFFRAHSNGRQKKTIQPQTTQNTQTLKGKSIPFCFSAYSGYSAVHSTATGMVFDCSTEQPVKATRKGGSRLRISWNQRNLLRRWYL